MRAHHEAGIVACIPSLRRYARGLTGDAHRADDLVQDTLERAWARISLWQRRGDLRAWMFGIMHNVYVDQVRRSRDRVDVELDATHHSISVRPTQTDGLEVRDLDRLLRELSADHRAVILLISVEELSYAQAAAVLGVAPGTVMSRLSRARDQLSELMDKRTPVTRIRSVK
jgi:RNA polymerase sigma-70 factor (ECF subfamily)